MGVLFLLETAKESVVFAVMPNPEPDNIGAVLHGSGSIVNADTNRPHPPDFLEVQRWMPRVVLEQFVICVGKLLNLLR